MSLVTVAAGMLAYLGFVAFVLTLLAAAKRADEAAEREPGDLVRSLPEWEDSPVQQPEEDRPEDVTARRRAG